MNYQNNNVKEILIKLKSSNYSNITKIVIEDRKTIHRFTIKELKNSEPLLCHDFIWYDDNVLNTTFYDEIEKITIHRCVGFSSRSYDIYNKGGKW